MKKLTPCIKRYVVLLCGLMLLGAVASADDPPRRVTKQEALAAATSSAQPEYPEIAKKLHLQGTVELEAVIGEDGAVESVEVVSGNPVLTKAATESLKKWRFKPFVVAGKATKVVAPVSFSFAM